jgi:hypothetical protein
VTIPAGAATTSFNVIPSADLLAEGTETLAVNLGAGEYIIDPLGSAVVSIFDRPFDAWRYSRFTTTQLVDTGIGGDFSDPDHDGLGNLLEYLANRDPLVADGAPLGARSFSAVAAEDYLTLSYTVAKSSEVSCVPEVSGDLQTWFSTSGAVEKSLISDDGISQSFTARDLVPRSAGAPRFIRLRAVRAE